MTTMRKPKVLIWDIETGYNLVRAHSLVVHSKYIHFDQLESERYIICAAFKELGKPGVRVLSIGDHPKHFTKNPTDDKRVVEAIHEELSSADAIIAHNGDRFDIRRFNGRAIFHGLPPLPPVTQIDTLKIARKHFDFNANRLDYLAQYLGVGEKLKFKEDLWKPVFHGDLKALSLMEKYNKRDVLILEKVYQRLAPYAKAKLNRALFSEDLVCPSCGSPNTQRRGTTRTLTRVYQRHSCRDCGHWFQGVRCDGSTEVK
jgi:predicted RNA-binding Zn-ribbon protein involved in translation (DUF1610 family)